jgi:hypothetical protein
MEGMLHIKQFSRPPEGTREVVAMEKFLPGKMRWAYTLVSSDKLWPKVACKEPDPEAWKELCLKYGNFTASWARKFWQNPEHLA